MSDDPKTPKHARWKKLTRFLIHAIYIVLSLMLFLAALANVIAGPTAQGVLALISIGIIISIFLVILEIIYFRRLDKPRRTLDFVKRYLGFLTGVVGRGILYQILGFPYMMDGNYHRYWRSNDGVVSVVLGIIIWSIGFCLMVIAILAKAYNFVDWIEDEDEEGGLQLESDDEDIGLLRDQGEGF